MPDAGPPGAAASSSPVVPSGPAASSAPQPEAENELLGTVAFALASCAPGAAGLVGPDVVTVTEATTSLLLAGRDACMPTATVAEFLSQMLRLDAKSLAAMNVGQVRSAVYSAVRGASPLLDAAGVSLAATTPGSGSSSSGAGGSPAPASGPAAPSSGSPSATSQPGIDPATVLGGVNSLPTDAELEWIQHVLRNRRYQVLRTYFTQWGDSIKGLPSFSDIQARLVTAAALQEVAAGPDSVTAPVSAAGFLRIPSSGALGVAVHQAVQAQYIADHPGNLICADSGVYNDGDVRTLGDLTVGASTGKVMTDEELKLFALAFKQLGRSDNSPLRSDIADLDLRTLYEIKPLTRAAEGVIQLWSYQAYLNMGFQYFPPKLGQATVFREGDWPSAPLVLLVSDDPMTPICAVVFQFTGSPDLRGFVPLPGLLLYELYIYQGNDLANALAILAASVISVLAARARQIGLAGPPANDNVEVPEEQPGKQAARVRETLRLIALTILAILIRALLAYLVYLLVVAAAAAVAALIAVLLGALLVAWDDTGTDLNSGDRAALAASFLDAASRVAAGAGLNAPAAPPGAAAG
jgi:hypothetical protein